MSLPVPFCFFFDPTTLDNCFGQLPGRLNRAPIFALSQTGLIGQRLGLEFICEPQKTMGKLTCSTGSDSHLFHTTTMNVAPCEWPTCF